MHCCLCCLLLVIHYSLFWLIFWPADVLLHSVLLMSDSDLSLLAFCCDILAMQCIAIILYPFSDWWFSHINFQSDYVCMYGGVVLCACWGSLPIALRILLTLCMWLIYCPWYGHCLEGRGTGVWAKIPKALEFLSCISIEIIYPFFSLQGDVVPIFPVWGQMYFRG